MPASSPASQTKQHTTPTMSLSLRKRLIKRPSTTNLRKANKESKSNEPLTIEQDNYTTTPPPPPEKISLPKRPEPVRTSPSKSLLERYKGRSPAAKGQALSTSSIRLPRPPERKTTAFTEEFANYDLSPISPTSQAMPFTLTVTQPATQEVESADFTMLTPADAGSQKRGRSAEPARSDPLKDELANDDGLQFRRATRSRTRRQERADLHAASVDTSIKTRDFAEPATPTDNEIEPRPLSIRKVSPSKPADKEDQPHLFAIRKVSDDDNVPVVQPATPVIELMVPTPSIKTSPTPANSPHRTRSRTAKWRMDDPPNDNAIAHGLEDDKITRVSNADITTIASDDDMMTHAPSSSVPSPDILLYGALDSPSSSSDSSEPEEICFIPSPRASVRVLPPVYNGQQLPGLQWISTLGASSRPAEPWSWAKRWTCCKCAGATIVEQEVCAKLRCGHERCGRLCKVIRMERSSAF